MGAILKTINGVAVPLPPVGGFSLQPETIWSKNTGRTANALMVGDIVGIKYTFEIEWVHLKESQVKTILDAAVNKGKPFFEISYIPFGQSTAITKTVYTASGYPKITKVDDDNINVSLQLIEQ